MATEYVNITGNVTTTIFVVDGVITAKREVTANGHYKSEKWFNPAGKLHRLDGPAEITCVGDKITAECWYKDGELHREDGGATNTLYGGNGKPQYQAWRRNWNTFHRIGGPAVIHYEDGVVCKRYWFIDGVEQPAPREEKIRAKIATMTKELAELEALYAEIGAN